MVKNNTFLEMAIKKIGSQKKLADEIGVVQSCVWKWLHGETRIPLDKAMNIELLTKGQVKCEELRPDINWSILRNKKATNAN
ncbi:helix-turn-helix domain-containing protein [Orbus wheelerorum]|uniref:transcriptional regulator n=1 Tax=Orbus wheelerorum TaxID=3074111 RepID=UPI00370D3119